MDEQHDLSPELDDLSVAYARLQRDITRIVTHWRAMPHYYDDCNPGQNDPYHAWLTQQNDPYYAWLTHMNTLMTESE